MDAGFHTYLNPLPVHWPAQNIGLSGTRRASQNDGLFVAALIPLLIHWKATRTAIMSESGSSAFTLVLEFPQYKHPQLWKEISCHHRRELIKWLSIDIACKQLVDTSNMFFSVQMLNYEYMYRVVWVESHWTQRFCHLPTHYTCSYKMSGKYGPY